jgi:hypothetical protein
VFIGWAYFVELIVNGMISPHLGVGISDTSTLGQDMTSLDADVIEMSLLLPRWQALALQSAARQRGMSAAQMLRRLIGATIGERQPTVVS